MVRTCLVVVASLVVFLGSGTAQDKAKLPKGPSPRFFTVTEVAKDYLKLTEVGPTRGDLTQNVAHRPAIKDIEILDPKGKKLSDEEFRKRVKVGAVVLVAADEKRVDPAYLSLLKDDAVVLVGVVAHFGGLPISPME